MINKSKLLNEVISDAKAVKDTAFKTAVQVLKEEFAPTMSRMISRKLAEEGEFDEEEDEFAPEAPAEDEVPTDEFAVAPEAPAEEVPVDEFGAEDEDDADLEEILRELEGEDDEEAPAAPAPAPIDDAPVDDEEDITSESLDALIREMEDEMSAEEEPVEDTPVAENSSKVLRRENSRLKNELKEAYQAITLQKNAINEVNLLNAKLMYLQKLNNKFKLNSTARMAVLETLDNAKNVREAKLVYATICKNMQKTTEAPKTTRIHESASRPTRSVTGKAPTAEFAFVKRFKELANIK